MTETAHETARRWLDAERRSTQAPPGAGGAGARPRHDGPELAAQRALRELMLLLPDVRPRPGFAQRVMAAAGVELHGAEAARHLTLLARTPPLRGALRALLAVCLLLAGSVVAYLPSLAQLVAQRVTLGDMIAALARTFTTMVDYMTVLIGVSKVLGALYDALLLVLTAPPVAWGWLAAVVFCTLTLRWLVRTLAPWRHDVTAERSSEYVSAHG